MFQLSQTYRANDRWAGEGPSAAGRTFESHRTSAGGPPPILLLHGKRDKVLPFAFSEYLVSVGKKKEADVKLLAVKGGGHSFKGKISPGMEEINAHAAAFILTRLRESTKSQNKSR